MSEESVGFLFVEDHLGRARSLQSFLRAQVGCTAEIVTTGEEALVALRSRRYAVVFIDWSLPGTIDGLEFCRIARTTHPTVGLFFLTARNALQDKVHAFDAGADDYLATPCDPAELYARAKAVARRCAQTSSTGFVTEPTYAVTGIVVDPEKRLLKGPRGNAELTPKELQFLKYLASSGPKGASTDALAACVLSRHDDSAENLVHRHLSNLRSKFRMVGLDNTLTRCTAGYVLKSA